MNCHGVRCTRIECQTAVQRARYHDARNRRVAVVSDLDRIGHVTWNHDLRIGAVDNDKFQIARRTSWLGDGNLVDAFNQRGGTASAVGIDIQWEVD